MSAGTIAAPPSARALRWSLELAPDAASLRVRWQALEREHPPACDSSPRREEPTAGVSAVVA